MVDFVYMISLILSILAFLASTIVICCADGIRSKLAEATKVDKNNLNFPGRMKISEKVDRYYAWAISLGLFSFLLFAFVVSSMSWQEIISAVKSTTIPLL